MEYKELSFEKIQTYPASIRQNLVRIDTLAMPGETPHETFDSPEFDELADRILEARANGRPVI